MKAPFWDFLEDESGFNKQMWFDAYVKSEQEKPLKQGKTKTAEVEVEQDVVLN